VNYKLNMIHHFLTKSSSQAIFRRDHPSKSRLQTTIASPVSLLLANTIPNGAASCSLDLSIPRPRCARFGFRDVLPDYVESWCEVEIEHVKRSTHHFAPVLLGRKSRSDGQIEL
jgi:hypothetical protein